MSGANGIGRDPWSTAKKNLALWHKEIMRLEELARLEACVMSEAIATKNEDTELLRERTNDLIGSEIPPHSPAVHAAHLQERIAICQALAKQMGAAPGKDALPLQASMPPLRIAMLNSPIFAHALTVFSPICPCAEPLFCRSFADVFEEISSARAAFGILPLEDSAEGKLFRIYEQIERFELHIACTTDIRGTDEKTVRVALLYKNEPPHIPGGHERILECLLFGNEGALADLLMVSTAFGLVLHRVDSTPLSYREDRFVQQLVLSDKAGGSCGLQLYLTLFMPHTTVTADYFNIKAKELSLFYEDH